MNLLFNLVGGVVIKVQETYRLIAVSVISLKTRSSLSHLIKRDSLMFLLTQYCLDFLIFTMIDSKFHFSPTFTSNLFFWTRNRNDIRLKHMTSSTLVKCNSMIISFVMPSNPVTEDGEVNRKVRYKHKYRLLLPISSDKGEKLWILQLKKLQSGSSYHIYKFLQPPTCDLRHCGTDWRLGT